MRDFFSEDPFSVFEEEDGTNRGKEFADILTVEEFSKNESLDGTTRIRSRVRVGKEGSGFFFLHFEYDRRPKGVLQVGGVRGVLGGILGWIFVDDWTSAGLRPQQLNTEMGALLALSFEL